jgi:hypothetical protein
MAAHRFKLPPARPSSMLTEKGSLHGSLRRRLLPPGQSVGPLYRMRQNVYLDMAGRFESVWAGGVRYRVLPSSRAAWCFKALRAALAKLEKRLIKAKEKK